MTFIRSEINTINSLVNSEEHGLHSTVPKSRDLYKSDCKTYFHFPLSLYFITNVKNSIKY